MNPSLGLVNSMLGLMNSMLGLVNSFLVLVNSMLSLVNLMLVLVNSMLAGAAVDKKAVDLSSAAVVLKDVKAADLASVAAALKDSGNACFKAGDMAGAIEHFTRSLLLVPSAVVLANRAAARLQVGSYVAAAEDASQAISADPTYIKVLCLCCMFWS
jgi:tetratricopeptide (TPR) repeat protein